MKQTAVEWLASKLNIVWEEKIIDLVEEAKSMEKEQIKDAWDDGYDKGTRDRIEKISNPVGNTEQYYNETFKSE
jgi:hypothetical protein